MIMSSITHKARSKEPDSATAEPQLTSVAADGAIFDKDRLVDIRHELAENQQHLPERIAATVEEDYEQLLKDFGLR
jgi:hypothetical protein